jgi:hypothetical protein
MAEARRTALRGLNTKSERMTWKTRIGPLSAGRGHLLDLGTDKKSFVAAYSVRTLLSASFRAASNASAAFTFTSGSTPVPSQSFFP